MIKVSRDQLIDAALKAAEEVGYFRFSRTDVTAAIGASLTVINYHFDSLDALRSLAMWRALKTNNAKVIAEGLAGLDPVALTQATEAHKELAAAFVRGGC